MSRLYYRFGNVKRQLIGGSCFSGQADNGKAVRPVRGNFKFGNGVRQANGFTDVHAEFFFAVVSQNEDTIFNGIWEIMNGQSQFGNRTHHAFGNLAAHFTFGNVVATGNGGLVQRTRNIVSNGKVLGTGDNLNVLFLSYVQLADPERVSIGVMDNFFYAANYNIRELGAFCLIGFYFGTGKGNGLGEVVVIYLQINIIL